MEEAKQSQEKPNISIPTFIEEFLNNPQNYINKTTITNFFLRLFQVYDRQKFLQQFSQNIQNKQIYFIRHAQSDYNLWKKDNILNPFAEYKNITSNYDPELTQKGIQQCQQLVDNLNNKDKPLKCEQFDIIYCSPLSRTIQTTVNVKKAKCFANIKKAVAIDLLREKSGKASQIGAKPAALKDRYDADIDFSFLVREKWWNFDETAELKRTKEMNEKEELVCKESKKNVLARLALFLVYIAFKQENQICVVSHSKIYKALEGFPIFSWASNAEGIWLTIFQLRQLVSDFIEKL